MWGAKLGDSFQVHAFDGPGVEVLSESGGCVLLPSRKGRFWVVSHLFNLFTNVGILKDGFRCPFLVF